MRARLSLAILVLLPASLLACIWDSDTLRYEAKGMPGLVEIITGRIDRPPPLYYEMRLDRASRAIATNPDDLAAYDDAGASCDRLGRSDDAVGWMARKKSALDRLGSPSEHLYRYHANLGTFLAHRWLRNGSDRANLRDMIDGREHIAKAIAINPDAHFGREKVQLRVMDWIIEPPDAEYIGGSLHTIFEANAAPGDPQPRVYNRGGPQTSWIDGLSGLVVMGSAWDSFDVFAALAIALYNQGDSYLAVISVFRASEIADAGGRSLHPANIPFSPEESPLAKHLKDALWEAQGPVSVYDEEDLVVFYKHARAESDLWHNERTEFMLARLKEGLHPDTHPGFWDGYRERAAPVPPGSLLSMTPTRRHTLKLLLLVGVPVMALLMIWRRTRVTRARAQAAT